MKWNKIGDTSCSVARALSVLGDRWTLLIVRELFLRTRRFEDFASYLGISPYLLTDRLNRLAAENIVVRVPYREHPPRFEYRLTEKGLELYPVLAALIRWGDRWMADEDGPPVRLVHRPCGRVMTPVLACPECGKPVEARQVTPQIGKRLAAERSAARRHDCATADGDTHGSPG